MAKLNMGRERYPLTKETINNIVSEKIGNYAFGIIEIEKRKDPKTGKAKKINRFKTKYVGRSDNNLKVEIIQQGITLKVDENKKPIYTHFAFTQKKRTPKTAYFMECENFHDFGGTQKLDNKRHPARPKNFTKETLPCSKKTCKD